MTRRGKTVVAHDHYLSNTNLPGYETGPFTPTDSYEALAGHHNAPTPRPFLHPRSELPGLHSCLTRQHANLSSSRTPTSIRWLSSGTIYPVTETLSLSLRPLQAARSCKGGRGPASADHHHDRQLDRQPCMTELRLAACSQQPATEALNRVSRLRSVGQKGCGCGRSAGPPAAGWRASADAARDESCSGRGVDGDPGTND